MVVLQLLGAAPSLAYECIANVTKPVETLLFVVQVLSILPTTMKVAIALDFFQKYLKQAAAR